MKPETRDGITYQLVQPHHRQAVLDVVARAFINEPSMAGCSLGAPTPQDWLTFTDFFMDECSSNGLSVVAMDGEKVAAAFINRDFLNPLPPGFEHFVAEPSVFAPIVGALVAIDEAWFAHHPEIDREQPGRVVDLWMVGVPPEYRRRGIANHLTELSLQVVANAGFEYAVVEATGVFSQAAMEKAGCSAVHTLPFAEFLWNGEAVFRDVPPPHSKWVIYEKNLRQMRRSAG